MKTHIGYCYQPKGEIGHDGFRPRMAVLCDEQGNLTDPTQRARFTSGGWVLMGHHEPGKAPVTVWDQAKQ
jgi:hypothetical protein